MYKNGERRGTNIEKVTPEFVRVRWRSEEPSESRPQGHPEKQHPMGRRRSLKMKTVTPGVPPHAGEEEEEPENENDASLFLSIGFLVGKKPLRA